jgi:hypothetical protein
MRSGSRHHLAWVAGLLILCWALLAYSQQVSECKRRCESKYWEGVSECYRSHTLYNDIRRCQDEKELNKRECTDRCSEPRGQEPGDCVKRCDRDYWDNHSTCYQSNYRYNDIRKCESSARETKERCRRNCSQRAKEGRP